MADWAPMTEQEEKKLKANRDRSSKISKLMGNYLLKGYKMLGSTCNKCQTILVQDRQGEDYCIGCVEVDAPPSPTAADVDNRPDVTQVTLPYNTASSNCSYSRTAVSSSDRTKANTSSIDNIISQINLINERFPSATMLKDRNDLIAALKLCYETLAIIQK